MRAAIVLVVLLVSSAFASAASVGMKSIVDPYVRIQRSLNADNLKGVQKSAQGLAAEAAKLGPAGDAILFAAGELQHSTQLTVARASFSRLSDAVIAYVKGSGVSLGEDVKVGYCPMLRKHWLQKGDTVQNPFYGKSMSECGRILTGLPDLNK